ncbi:NACHT domain-containing protein [Umezawaea sp. Da 62-37]|uniref:NACHT domain-containing protein n=1 Tax=Umezawaea sp. Da 62-37 TaxID=3075927 RepID=UPI0028F6C4C1|nr:NACHT domain-containing protein [Umezawaea sp. Da 62-37]WNV84876.1 NACHT domain-containing protein [Umezawaea sp. Da 62-37]
MTKIRSDLARITAGGPVDVVYAFLVADLPIARIHVLQAEAKAKYGITLEIFDGPRLATMMATTDFAATAFRWLRLDPRMLSTAARTSDEAKQWATAVLSDQPRPELHQYLKVLRNVGERDLRAADRIPDLDSLYQPLALTGPDSRSRTWEQALAEGDHLVVTGSAGAGKSALLRHIATTLANQWLHEPRPWFPVLVQARDLASGKPLEQALHAGIERTLGSRLLRRPDLDFLDRPSPSTRWLILVDGLDETHDRREVLDAVEAAMDDRQMQFMITSRPFEPDLKRDWYVRHTLQPFDRSSLDRFITEWFAHSGAGSAVRRGAAQDLVDRLDDADWEPNPLFAVMACVIADTDPASAHATSTSTSGIYSAFVDQVVAGLESTRTHAIDAIQDQIHRLLESVASHRYFDDPDASVLDLALRWAEEHGIEPPDPLRAGWAHIVRQVLLRSGLIISDRDELMFFHPSLQEYYAARTLAGSSPQEWLDALERTPYWYETRADIVLSQTTFLEFLLDRTNEDAFVAAVIDAFPEAAERMIEHYGLRNLGDPTTQALETVAADRHELVEDRAGAAKALAALDPKAGVLFRLELSMNLDLEDERLPLISSLIRLGGAPAAAMQWLIFQTWDRPVDSSAESEIRSLMAFVASDKDKAGGLRLIAKMTALPERWRVAACADLVPYGAAEAYRLFLTTDQPQLALLELVDSRPDCWPTLHQRFVRDNANSFVDRMRAIELIEDDDPDRAVKYYRELGTSPLVTDSQRAAIDATVEELRS